MTAGTTHGTLPRAASAPRDLRDLGRRDAGLPHPAPFAGRSRGQSRGRERHRRAVRDGAAIARLDRPLHERYLVYVSDLVQGDLGRSWFVGQPTLDMLLERIPDTIELTVVAALVGIPLAIALGVVSAVWRRTTARLRGEHDRAAGRFHAELLARRHAPSCSSRSSFAGCLRSVGGPPSRRHWRRCSAATARLSGSGRDTSRLPPSRSALF